MVSWKVTTELHLNCSRNDLSLWLYNNFNNETGNLRYCDDFVRRLILGSSLGCWG